MASDDIFEDEVPQKKQSAKTEKENIGSKVDHPSHYNSGKIEVIDAIEDWDLNFSRGNAIKYIARAGLKDKGTEIEDLQKALWYIQREIKRLS
jgi:hypothetical protein